MIVKAMKRVGYEWSDDPTTTMGEFETEITGSVRSVEPMVHESSLRPFVRRMAMPDFGGSHELTYVTPLVSCEFDIPTEPVLKEWLSGSFVMRTCVQSHTPGSIDVHTCGPSASTPSFRTERARKLWSLRERIAESGLPQLSWDDIEREIQRRRGERK